jgi:hypothetical protein
MCSKLSLGVSPGIFALALSAVPASVHHGWGGNLDQEFELTGTVGTGVSVAGPHATMKVRADGKLWDITLGLPPQTQAAGLKEGIIPVGATVTIHGPSESRPQAL